MFGIPLLPFLQFYATRGDNAFLLDKFTELKGLNSNSTYGLDRIWGFSGLTP